MGTSTSNNGPLGIGGLLPSWYSADDIESAPLPLGSDENAVVDPIGQENESNLPADENSSGTSMPNPMGTWSNAKGAFTRFTNNTKGSNIRKAAKSYIKTLGGSRNATKLSSGGIAAGSRLGTFLGSTISQGLTTSLAAIGLSAYIGRSSEEILAKIADTIAPDGSTNDEAIARDAIIATLDFIYTKIVDNGDDILALESLSPEMVKDAVIAYVSMYIFKKWIYELGIAVEKNTISEKQAIDMEVEIKDFIGAEVRLAMQDKTIRDFDLNSESNQRTIESIFQTAYSILQQ